MRLEGDAREKIRELINKIKLTIEAIELPLPRKEALMSRLNDFAAEVDKDRTRFEAFGALMIEAAGVAKKVERRLRPIRKWIDSVANVCTRPARLRMPALACPHRTSALRPRQSRLRPRLASCGHRRSRQKLPI